MKHKLRTRIKLEKIFELSAYFLLKSVFIHLNMQLFLEKSTAFHSHPLPSVPLPTITDWRVFKYGATRIVLQGILCHSVYFCIVPNIN